MLNLKKTLALFLAAGFLYEGNAAMARGSNIDFAKQSVARRLATKKPGVQLSRPLSRAGKGFSSLPMRSRVLTTKQGPQELTRTVNPLRKKGTSHLARPSSQRLQPGMRTATVKAGRAAVQPTKRFSAQQFTPAMRTAPVKAAKTVVRPMRSLTKTEPLSPRTAPAKAGKAVVQPTKRFSAQQFTPGMRTATVKAGKAVVQPMRSLAAKKTEPLSPRANHVRPQQNRASEGFFINSADLPPEIVHALAAEGFSPRGGGYSVTPAQLVTLLSELQEAEREGQLPHGTTERLKRKYRVTIL